MTFYIDTSVVVPLFVDERHTRAAVAWMEHRPSFCIGRLTLAEAGSAISRLRRMDRMDDATATQTLDLLDGWLAGGLTIIEHTPEDFIQAAALVRSPRPKLLSPDALHLATSLRLGATLVTFDNPLAEVCRLRGGTPLVPAS